MRPDGLYDVPQTDSTSEPAMAALVARLRATCPKPETIDLESKTPGTDAKLALFLYRAKSSVESAFGDHITPPLLAWDGNLDEVACTLAYQRWMNFRGRERKQGADNSIDANADEARAYLARLRPSSDGKGKSENPRYIDAGGGVPRDAPFVASSPTSDNWIYRQGTRPLRFQ